MLLAVINTKQIINVSKFCVELKMLIKTTAKGLIATAALTLSAIASATTFNFAAIADGDSSYGFVGAEFGAPSITFTKEGITVDATGFDAVTGAVYNAYLDSTWIHGGGGGAGGLGVCKEVKGSGQCSPGSDDNVTIDENLMLDFGSAVTISELTFRNGEHNPIFANDATFDLIIDRGLATQSMATYSLGNIFTMDLTGTTFEFLNLNTVDNDDYRFYISVMEVTAVPVPAAVWLFGSGLLGLVGIARRRNA